MLKAAIPLLLATLYSGTGFADSCIISLRKAFEALGDCGRDREQCRAICDFAEPASQPQCFLQEEIDCQQRAELSEFLRKPLNAGGSLIVTRSELFRFYKQKKPDLYQYYTLKNLEWAGYRDEPSAPTEGTRIQKVANFRLGWQVLLNRHLARLRASSLKKSYRASVSWEAHLRHDFFQELDTSLENFGLMNSEEKAKLRSDLETQMINGMSLWLKTVGLGAKAYLEPKLKTLDKGLSDTERSQASLTNMEQIAGTRLAQSVFATLKSERESFRCAGQDFTSCLDEPTALDWDARTDRLLTQLDLVSRHFKAFEKLQTILPEGMSIPPAKDQIVAAGEQFLKDPANENLELLLAGLWAAASGVEQAAEQWNKLEADPTIDRIQAQQGLELAEGSHGPVSCDIVATARDEIVRLRKELNERHATLEQLIEANKGVASRELFQAIDRELETIRTLTQRKTQISAQLNLKTDRVQRYVWDLSPIIATYQPGSTIQIEWLQLGHDTIPWRLNLSAGWSAFAQDILALKTDSETFDSYGFATLGPNPLVEIATKENPIIACSGGPKPRLLIRVRDHSGHVRKIILNTVQ